MATAATPRETLKQQVARMTGELERSHVAFQKLQERRAELEAELDAARAAVVAAAPAAIKTVAERKPHEPCTCGKCGGSGWYDEAEGRICFQCQGKGVQDDADQRRNWGYARNHSSRPSNRVSNGSRRVDNEELEARRAAMAAAKAAAMASGKSVVVSHA